MISFLCFSLHNISGQITFEPNCLDFVADDVDRIRTWINITNTTENEIGVYWKFEPAMDFPEAWRFQVRDISLTYNWNVSMSASSTYVINTISPSQTVEFYIEIRHDNVFLDSIPNITGTTYGTLYLYDQLDFMTPIAQTDCTVSNANIELNESFIYPNPTNNNFQISNDQDVTKIMIYDMNGILIKRISHSKGRIHNMAALNTGLYLVKLEDSRGKLMDVVKLSKI